MTDLSVFGPVGRLYACDSQSSGRAVVLVHALAGSSAHWRHQMEHLSGRHRAVALDLRGHGRSATTDGADYALSALAEDLAAVVDQCDLDSFLLVGHSLGAGVAGSYAGDNPGRVAGLLLADPIGEQRLAPEDEAAAFLAALNQDYRTVIEAYWATILRGASAEVQRQVLEDLRYTPRRVVIESFRRMAQFDMQAALGRFAGPTANIITPINDAPFSLHKLIPSLPTKTVTGTSHWLQLDRPVEFNRLLDDFLDQCARFFE